MNLTMSDFSAFIIGEYVDWISAHARLKNIDVGAVYSFRVGSGGVKSLLQKKLSLYKDIMKNVEKIDCFLVDYDVAPENRAVVEVIRANMQSSLEVVSDHVDKCRLLLGAQENFIEYVPIDDDEVPF